MRRSLGSLIVVILLTNVSPGIGAADSLTQLSLDEAINMAMTTNLHIQSLQAGNQAVEGQARAEKNRWLGEVMLNGGVALHEDDTLIRPITRDMMLAGPLEMPFDDQYAFWNLAYRLPIYGGGSVTSARESARLSAQASNTATDRAILRVRHQVLVTYVDILSLDAKWRPGKTRNRPWIHC